MNAVYVAPYLKLSSLPISSQTSTLTSHDYYYCYKRSLIVILVAVWYVTVIKTAPTQTTAML